MGGPSLESASRFDFGLFLLTLQGRENMRSGKRFENVADPGFDGVEILHRQISGKSVPYLNQLKRSAFRNGLDLIQLAIHRAFNAHQALNSR